jgi:drug/metabolite transporter (DMT)-like permease
MRNNQWKIALAFACVYIIWGSTYLGILLALKTIPPLLMTSLRFIAAGTLLFTWRFWKRDKIPSNKTIQQNGICGILTLFGGVGSVAWGEQFLSSSVAAIIVTALPFWFVLFDKKQWGFYFSNKIILLGLLFGAAGVALLVGFSPANHASLSDTHNQLLGSLIILCGGIGWATGSLYSKKIKGDSMLMNASLQFIIAGIFSLLVSLLLGEWKAFSFSHISETSWLALFYLITMGSLVTYLAYLWLLKKRPAAQVSTYVYVNPVIALLLGAWIAGEHIGPVQVIALAVILLGVVMVNIPKYRS